MNNKKSGNAPARAPLRRTTVKRSRLSGRAQNLLTILIAAILLLAVLFTVLYLCGFRYTTYKYEGGETRFIGRVDREGAPLSGSLRYADGTSGSLSYTKTEGQSLPRIDYSGGDFYVGTLDEYFRRSGEGSLTLISEGAKYIGEFSANLPNGSGTFTYNNGDSYEGGMKDGKKDGNGKYIYADGSVYEGGFSDGKRDGEGKYKGADGYSYDGGYSADRKSGNGIQTLSNGDRYEGGFADDMRSGSGLYEWINGEKYEGQFANNKPNGEGTYTWPSGRTYTGAFKDGIIVQTEAVQ